MRFDLPPFLVVLVGPTAVGKTELAIEVAERIKGEIVSADSRLFYLGMDIGTAKPTAEQRKRVRHHLVDVANPDETWSVAVFQQAARECIVDIWSRKKIPLLVGGTGQFIRAITEEWSIPVQAPDEKMRDVLTHWGREIGPVELHRKVGLLDSEAAAHIEPNNLRRSVRALEVMLLTGKRFSEQRQKKTPVYEICQVGLIRPREELYKRVDERIEKMVAMGFLEEVESLLKMGYKPDTPALSAIGYREMIGVISGMSSMEEAILLIKRNTRKFIRRQANWFKESDPVIRWFRAGAQTTGDLTEYLWAELTRRGYCLEGDLSSQEGSSIDDPD